MNGDTRSAENVIEARCAERRAALERLFEEQLSKLERVHEQRLAGADRALQLQAREYERRLDELNHEHARARETAAKTVPRETFEMFKEQFESFKYEQGQMHAATRSAAMTWGAALGIALTVLSLALRFWK